MPYVFQNLGNGGVPRQKANFLTDNLFDGSLTPINNKHDPYQINVCKC